MLEVRTTSLAGTRAVAAAVAGLSRGGDLIVLAGEMGAGKTAFAQGFGAHLGVGEPITSPTFNLVHTYTDGRVVLHHADLYRLGSHHELDDLSLGELAEDGIVLVEWGDVVAGVLGDHLCVQLTRDLDPQPDPDGDPDHDDDEYGDDGRTLTITASGRRWATRWSALADAVRHVASRS